MLQRLSIENYALIESLEIDPHKALNIITGETGAGKSIMLGALGLLLGNRAETKVLLNQDKKCIIEAEFNISSYSLSELFELNDIEYEEVCIVRREINTKGKSRAFVNDGLTNLEFLKQLGLHLMDVHSQHETLRLGNRDYQLEIIDIVAGTQKNLLEYQKAFKNYKEKATILKSLKQEGSELQKEADYHQFLFKELDDAALKSDEQEALESEQSKLEHAEEIKLKLHESLQLSDQSDFNLLSQLQDLKSLLNQISNYGSNYKELKERIESVQIELKDIVSEITDEESKVVFDPQRAEEVQERLSLIYKLQQKHQVASIEELQNILEELSDKVLRVENLDEAIEEAEKVMKAAEAKAMSLAESLSEKRMAVFTQFSESILQSLDSLGMPNAAVEVERTIAELGKNGIDQIEIKFSANKGVQAQPLKQAASGGEFSRLMFAIKYLLADKTALPTIVFDEIDTGISGEIAIKMASMMLEMAKKHQVITITHLPQIAAKGHKHYFVYKDESHAQTTSRIRPLVEQERLQEIAEMIGGKNASDTAFQSARELMQAN